jgi:hypothetical protein
MRMSRGSIGFVSSKLSKQICGDKMPTRKL